jgi:RNA polymerase sigma-70 factor (ECF subfamily)
MSSEKHLIKQAREFNEQALAEIYDRYSPSLYRYAIRLLGNADQAEDCIAETFSRFLHVLQKGGGPNQYLQAYLYRIAHNWVTDYFLSKSQLPLELEFPIEKNIQTDPQSASENSQTKMRVREALMQLTPDQHQVIVLKFYDGLSNSEVAKAMRKPIGSIKSLQHRALRALNRLLIDE